MIAHLRGRVALREPGAVVVDVGGVGYLVHVTAGERVPPRGEPVEMFTSMQVREESISLYGFTDRSALGLFEALLTSSGVGPKLALAALGTHSPMVLRAAIAGGDLATLSAIPGVGKKVAQRLVLELKDKVGGDLAGEWVDASAPAGSPKSEVLDEVRSALFGLGYSAGEVQGALTEIGAVDGADTSALLREALRSLGSGASNGGRR